MADKITTTWTGVREVRVVHDEAHGTAKAIRLAIQAAGYYCKGTWNALMTLTAYDTDAPLGVIRAVEGVVEANDKESCS